MMEVRNMRKMWKKFTTILLSLCIAMTMFIGTGGAVVRASNQSPYALWLFKNGTKSTIDFYQQFELNTQYANSGNAVFEVRHANPNKYAGVSYDAEKELVVFDNVNISSTEDDGTYFYANMINFHDCKGIYGKGNTALDVPLYCTDFHGLQGNTNKFLVDLEPGAKITLMYGLVEGAEFDIEDRLTLGEGVVKERNVVTTTQGYGDQQYQVSVANYTFTKLIDISTLAATSTLSFTSAEYTGSPIEPTVTVPGMTKDVDYTVAYVNNTEVGTATVTITGKGKCQGTFTLNFTITAKPVIEEAKDDKGSDYKISTNGDTQEATYTAPKTKNEKKVTVPDEITLPDGSTAKVTAIAKNAFKGNTKLTNATIGNNVKTIGDNAFNGCSKLTSLKLGNKVENIGKGAVSNCKSLKSVTVPASTKSIGKNAFKGDTNLKTLTINCKNLKSVDKDAIKNINPKATIKLKGSTKQKKAAEKLITKSKTGYKKSMKIKK
ncbi:MAG: leucine-rich repeat domain-containing protein [Butyrivibrio sp.]|nr:leucine-rich repeat domain-containing protein [Butyrivibrio sp.]